ncbi:MAG TPA: flagellar basal body P-ring formation chaperone FlgA [Oligoflexia bacterium]|nr:flagellar basal body P-ring formation chaperone FlgA [Oligoflexia bacterium]
MKKVFNSSCCDWRAQHGSSLRLISLKRMIAASMLTVLLFVEAHAESTSLRPTLVVAPEVSIADAHLSLGSIARIDSKAGEFDDLVEALRSVSLGEAPPPSTKINIPGVRILEAIQNAGIALDALGYSIPQVVVVERQGHKLTEAELLPHVRDALAKDHSLDIQVQAINLQNTQIIPAGPADYSIDRLGRPQGGKIPLRITVNVGGVQAARFLATAVVDDWREIPVLNKTLERGMLISHEDVDLVRMNLFKQPANIAGSIQEIVGRRAKQRLGAGETIRKNLIDIPPVIPAGKSVMMIYRSSGLEASASGVAMEDGFDDSVIKVKNDTSKRVLKARVINPDQVEVSPQ